jgi:enamine deaminase RidA (YjgF/YER057c/UK114 family)
MLIRRRRFRNGTDAMTGIARISSEAPWEPIFGYTRAVKAGGWLAVSGTTSFDADGLIVGRNQMYVQARQAIANIAAALERAGMSLADVVRTRVFVTDMERFGDVARAHLEAFGDNPPASTVVEVRRLVNADMMIEIEADAYRPAEKSKALSKRKDKAVAKRKDKAVAKRGVKKAVPKTARQRP